MLTHTLFTMLALGLLLPTLPLVVEVLVLSLAALMKPVPVPATKNTEFRLAVLVPAHNEQALVGRCVESLLRSVELPSAVYVVAHNCKDDTAAVAAEAGATVLPLADDGQRGKGAALFHGFTHALQNGADAVLVIDADSHVSSELTRIVTGAFQQGEDAVQVRYVAEHAADGERTQLLALALYGMNVLRPRGRTRLGLSCGIFGNGFAVSRATLQAVPYTAHSVVEDLEYHLHLVRSVRSVRFLNAAEVCGEIPDNRAAAGTQRARWEGGRARMRREFAPLLLRAVLRGRLRMLEPLLDLLALPIGTCFLMLAIGLLVPVPLARAYSALGLAGMLLYVTVSACLSPKPARMFSALLNAPGYLLSKLLLVPATRRASKAGSAWVRTQRNSTIATELSPQPVDLDE